MPASSFSPAFATASIPPQPFAPREQVDGALRQAITAAYRIPEPQALAPLMELARTPAALQAPVHELALKLARNLRERKADQGRAGIVQGLLQEFALSSQEGVALMCLAEALLRIPDAATRDALIRDKIGTGDWDKHLGRSPSLFVNAATWGLLITGKLVATHSEGGLRDALRRITARGGEPLIRKGVDMAMRMMGEQFVTGETIAEALKHARPLEAQGFRYSYDMLGEAALTADDAERYMQSYVDAINAIGKASNGRGVYEGPGISIKLSALHPRYSRAQHARVMAELYPRVLQLAQLAKRYDIGLNIDAEEADRLELSLDLLEKLCHEPELAGFKGIGFVIQAYQKRCPFVIDYVIDLARRSQHRLMVRLVKGAYWDSEIKRAQVDGLADYPVYTRKSHTDVSYIACARKLLGAPDAIYPQFATHNAQTLATIYMLADPATYQPGQYEFQCLHGMGEPLYEQVVGDAAQGRLARPCRVYAPVGTHETLLAYLVRRLLENGANTSFVNRVADKQLPLESLIENPVATVDADAQKEGQVGLSHPRIPLPHALYGTERSNSAGVDLSNETVLSAIEAALRHSAAQPHGALPLLAAQAGAGDISPVTNPANRDEVVGEVREATSDDVNVALAAAEVAQPNWAATPPARRAAMLRHAADLLQDDMPAMMALTMREAGKTASNAVAEVREAIDFLRYYAAQAELLESDAADLVPLGPVTCISPWNFPLAIFMGQVTAALAAGNTVLAKPAEQTPLIAARAVALLHRAGVPAAAVQLLPGRGETVGAQLVGDPRVMGVMFTGSTEVARILQRNLAGRLNPQGQPIPLIAETGGQNALIVDSSALAEQVVVDVVSSAFDSAGQRCSALRVLCVQADVADRIGEMLRGAMQELRVGNPTQLAVDMGPVIDEEARNTIEAHIERMRAKGHTVYQPEVEPRDIAAGCFVKPTLIELDSLSELGREVFGPVLHMVRYERDALGQLLDQINGTGYGLTQGLHTRIDETVATVVEHARAGNVYVNRNIVGAVVGVQPFGGEGLSGTGPKAGGPLYMLRLMSRHPADAAHKALNATAVRTPDASVQTVMQGPLKALAAWAQEQQRDRIVKACEQHARAACGGLLCTLPGPTGERNEYRVLPREQVLCVADTEEPLLVQLSAVLAVGARALWPASHDALRAKLPAAVQQRIVLAQDWTRDGVHFDAVLHAGSAQSLQQVGARLAERDGAIVHVTPLESGDRIALERLVLERALSVNTAAAGGNASLMTLA